MRLIAIILILTSSSLISQEIKRVDSDRSSIRYSGKHFLHKWSAEPKFFLDNFAQIILIKVVDVLSKSGPLSAMPLHSSDLCKDYSISKEVLKLGPKILDLNLLSVCIFDSKNCLWLMTRTVAK